MNFNALGLSQKIVTGLEAQNITEPTLPQEQHIPQILKGEDTLIHAQTGAGKTLAYLLPIYQRQPEVVEKGTQVIVIVPTKELAMQVHHAVISLSNATGIPLKSATLFGSVNIKNQIELLKDKPQIVIGTTDRVLELIKRKKVAAHLVKTFIVDEADKLLDKSNIEGLKAVRKTLMRDTQNIFVSATFNQKDLEQMKTIAPNLSGELSVQKETIPENIGHYFLVCDPRDKLDNLRKLIGLTKPQRSLIFINELDDIHVAMTKLNFHKLPCVGIHSDTGKQERQRSLQQFSRGECPYLVATDLASRGLHVENIDCVFHVSVAENPSDYLHRSGRTGRNGHEGLSFILASKQEIPFIKKYQSRFGIKIEEIKIREGKIINLTTGAELSLQ